MKISMILLLVGVMHLSASTFSQTRVSLNMKDATVQEIFSKLEKMTNYTFLYKLNLVDKCGKMNVNATNKDFNQLLEDLLRPLGLSFTIDDQVVVITASKTKSDEKKEITIKGRVFMKDSTGVPGATIILKGTSIGLITNMLGEFTLTIPYMKSPVLIFSFLGMKTREVRYVGQKEMLVLMEEDVKAMDEVIVTGYQRIRKSDMVGSTNTVKREDLFFDGTNSIEQMLQGKLPGMLVMNTSGLVGKRQKVRVRGTSTLLGNQEPVWVVDGIIQEDPLPFNTRSLDALGNMSQDNFDMVKDFIGNAIAWLNPNDIEDITVLKDASATVMYGVKAANGVILIKTKRGKAGRMSVNYSGNLTFTPRLTYEKMNLMNSKERMEFSKDLVESGYKFPGGMNMVGYEGLVNQLYRGALTYDEFTKQVQYLECLNTDWFDLLTEDAFSHQHTVSISGGMESVRYYSSVGYAKDNDVIKGNNNERYTVALNLNADLSPRISTSLGINGNVTSREYSQDEIAPLDYAYNTSRAIPAFDENGDYYYYQSSGGTANSFRYNILNELDNSSYDQEGSSISFNMTLNVKFTDYLNASAVGSYSTSNTDIEGWWGEKSHHVALLRQSEYGDAPAKGDDSRSALPFGGELTTNSTRNRNYMLRVQLNLDKYFGQDKHNVNASVGYEVSSTKYKGNSSTMRGYYKDRGKQFSITTLNDYPAFKTWLEANAYPTISDNLTNLLSAYATVSYSYQSFFTLNGNVRFDGSNKFGDQSNDKLLPIWSLSGNYTISEHEWLQRSWIDYIMLKASFGYQGNMLEGQSPTMIIKQLPTDPLYNELVAELSVYPNPNLKWEKTSSFNGGLTFSLFKRRLQMETSVYYKRTKDAFLVNGLEEYVVNSGNVKNSGYSIAATIIPVETRDFNWILATSFSNVFNKVETLPGAEQFELSNFLNGTALVKGKPVGTFYSYKFVGLNPTNGYPIFDDMQERQEELEGLTKYDVYTRVLKATGNREPTMSGNINNTFRYKNWRLNMNLAYSLGSKVRLFKLFDSNTFLPENNVRREFVKRWRKTGDEKNTIIPTPNCYWTHYSSSGEKIPTIANNSLDMYNYSDIRVVSGNYLKCSTMSVTYEFPMEKLERIKLSRFALNFSATNLFTICSNKLKGQAPQQSGFAKIQLTDRPTYTVGVSVSF